MTQMQPADQRPVWPGSMWRSSVPVVGGVLVALMLYAMLYSLFIPLHSDEDLETMQPWWLAGLNFVYYTPICLAQWLVLRRYVRRAFWWVIATLMGVSVVQPSMVGILWALDLDMLAFVAWLFGLGSGMFAAISQWIVLRRWTRRSTHWLGLIPLIWIGTLAVSLPLQWLVPGTYTEYVGLGLWGLYQGLLSFILLYVLGDGHQAPADALPGT